MAWLAGGGTRSEQFPAGLSLTLNWLGCARRFLWDGQRLCGGWRRVGGSDDGDCDDGIPRSRNRLPCWSRHLPRRCPRRKVKRSAVEIASKSFSEIQRYIRYRIRRVRITALTCSIGTWRFAEGEGWNKTPRSHSHLHLPISSSQIRNKLLRGVVGSHRFFLSSRREGSFYHQRVAVFDYPLASQKPSERWSCILRRVPLAFSARRLSLTIKVRPPWFHVDRRECRAGVGELRRRERYRRERRETMGVTEM